METQKPEKPEEKKEEKPKYEWTCVAHGEGVSPEDLKSCPTCGMPQVDPANGALMQLSPILGAALSRLLEKAGGEGTLKILVSGLVFTELVKTHDEMHPTAAHCAMDRMEDEELPTGHTRGPATCKKFGCLKVHGKTPPVSWN